jgi:hypothetical protein
MLLLSKKFGRIDKFLNWHIFSKILFSLKTVPNAKITPNREVPWVTISPTFYARLFHTKVFCKAVLYLHFRFELSCVQEYWRKYAYKMLVKLNKGHKKTFV